MTHKLSQKFPKKQFVFVGRKVRHIAEIISEIPLFRKKDAPDLTSFVQKILKA